MFAIMFALSIIQYQLTGVTYHARKQIYLCLLMSHRRKYMQIYWIVNQYQYTDIVLVHSILYIIKTHPIIWCCSIQIVLHAYMPHTVLSSQWISSCKLNIAESWNCISHLSHLFILMGFLMHVSVSGPVPTSWGFHPGPFVKTCWAWPPLPQPRKRATTPTFRDICDN